MVHGLLWELPARERAVGGIDPGAFAPIEDRGKVPMSRREFIDKHLRHVQKRRSRGPKGRESCLLVTRVAERSIAARAGIERGDLIVSVAGIAANEVNWNALASEGGEFDLVFFSPAAREEREARVTAVPLGVETTASDEFVMATAATELFRPAWLMRFWESGDFKKLLRISESDLKGRGWRANNRENNPSLVMHGAALFELGKEAAGFEEISEYAEHYMQNWTTDFASIAYYYHAIAADREGDRSRAIDLLYEAWQQSPSDRTAATYKAWTGERLEPKALWQGKPFFCEYRLPVIAGGSGVLSFEDALCELEIEEMHTVCLLGGYRANGPYASFVCDWIRVALTLPDHFKSLHVITESDAAPEYEELLEPETWAIQNGVACTVLHDASGRVGKAAMCAHSPFVVVVDSQGCVLVDGHLDEITIWGALQNVL